MHPDTAGRRSPTSPGCPNFGVHLRQSLFEKLDTINEELVAYAAMLIVMSILLYASYISDLYFQKRPLSLNLAFVYIVIGGLFVGGLIFRVVRLLHLRRNILLGYEGEVATGQE